MLHKVKMCLKKAIHTTMNPTKLFFKFLLNSLSKSKKSKKWNGYHPKRKYGRKRSLEPLFLPLSYLKTFNIKNRQNFSKIFQVLAKEEVKKWFKYNSCNLL